MKSYELIIERTQPPCGGKLPKTHEILTVQTDDLVAFVKSREPATVELEITEKDSYTTVISFTKGAQNVVYEFTLID